MKKYKQCIELNLPVDDVDELRLCLKVLKRLAPKMVYQDPGNKNTVWDIRASYDPSDPTRPAQESTCVFYLIFDEPSEELETRKTA